MHTYLFNDILWSRIEYNQKNLGNGKDRHLRYHNKGRKTRKRGKRHEKKGTHTPLLLNPLKVDMFIRNIHLFLVQVFLCKTNLVSLEPAGSNDHAYLGSPLRKEDSGVGLGGGHDLLHKHSVQRRDQSLHPGHGFWRAAADRARPRRGERERADRANRRGQCRV